VCFVRVLAYRVGHIAPEQLTLRGRSSSKYENYATDILYEGLRSSLCVACDRQMVGLRHRQRLDDDRLVCTMFTRE